MLAHERDALAVMRAVYGEEIRYTGAGLDDAPLVAIRSDSRAAPMQGFSGRADGLSFEIDYAALPDRPAKRNIIVDAQDDRWSVIDVGKADDIESWILTVEEAGPQP